jgi:hydroxymethylbilane synthase
LKSLRIGTRASALARWQAESVKVQLAALGCASELMLIRTSGDQDRQTPLREIGGKGVFTKEIEAALLENRVDLAVHSMKDLPTTLPEGLVIGAVGRREDVRDALISREGLTLDALPLGARVGTSSLRRQAQLRNRRPDLQMADVRGNVDTRLGKVERGEYDAIILAKAGLDRLGLSKVISEVLAPEVCLPAAGQGAIGIEMRVPANDFDRELAVVLGQLNHTPSRLSVETERAVLAGLSGGCDLPLGVWAREESGDFLLNACVLSADGTESVRVRRAGVVGDAEAIARAVTAELRSQGADRLLDLGDRSHGAP